MILGEDAFMKKRFLFVALAMMCAFCLFAEPRHALLIANNKYETLSNLGTPIKEARDLKKVLEKMNFKVTIVENATLKKMSDSIIDFEDLLNASGGVGFFHYGGHAVQVNGKNYLIPVDADIPSERKVASRTVDVDEVMTSMVADTNIVILDACRNNPLPASEGRSASRGLVVTGVRPKNSIIIYSAQAGSVATDGVFTPQLTKHLEEKKEFSAILREVRSEVHAITDGAQMPGEYSQLMTSVYLNGEPPASAGYYGKKPAWFDCFPGSMSCFAAEFRKRCPTVKIPDETVVFIVDIENKDVYSLEKQADFECMCDIQSYIGASISSVISKMLGNPTNENSDAYLETSTETLKVGNDIASVNVVSSLTRSSDGKEDFNVKLETPKGSYDVYDKNGKFALSNQAISWMNFAFNQAYPKISQSLKKIEDFKEYDNKRSLWKYKAIFCIDKNALDEDVKSNLEKSF